MTPPSIVDEGIEKIFYAFDDSGGFKVCFYTPIFDCCEYRLNKQWNSSSDAWSFVQVENLMCWLYVKRVDPFCCRVHVIPNYRLIARGDYESKL